MKSSRPQWRCCEDRPDGEKPSPRRLIFIVERGFTIPAALTELVWNAPSNPANPRQATKKVKGIEKRMEPVKAAISWMRRPEGLGRWISWVLYNYQQFSAEISSEIA
jgi:hypothetical protein